MVTDGHEPFDTTRHSLFFADAFALVSGTSKLFLSVERMVFVIAADQEMVRDAIAVSLGASSRSERFAKRYLDKIVQLPVSLPRLAPH